MRQNIYIHKIRGHKGCIVDIFEIDRIFTLKNVS